MQTPTVQAPTRGLVARHTIGSIVQKIAAYEGRIRYVQARAARIPFHAPSGFASTQSKKPPEDGLLRFRFLGFRFGLMPLRRYDLADGLLEPLPCVGLGFDG